MKTWFFIFFLTSYKWLPLSELWLSELVQCLCQHTRPWNIQLQLLPSIINKYIIVCVSVPTGINQFNPMAMQNAQMSQAPMGARAPSPMNHPQQMNMSSVPSVSLFSLFFLMNSRLSISLLNSFLEPFFRFCHHVCFVIFWLFSPLYCSFWLWNAPKSLTD